MATVQEQLRLIGLSLSHAAGDGDFAAVAKWAAKATALVGRALVKQPASAYMPSLMPLSLDEATKLIAKGRSADIDEYLQQLFALEAFPQLVGPISGSWPSAATDPAWRRQTLVENVAAEIGSGPAYGPTSLTCGQVLAAQAWAEVDPGLNLNPVYAVALGRAAKVAAGLAPNAPIPWGEAGPIEVIPTGSYGQTPVSGYYGTGDGPVPSA